MSADIKGPKYTGCAPENLHFTLSLSDEDRGKPAKERIVSCNFLPEQFKVGDRLYELLVGVPSRIDLSLQNGTDWRYIYDATRDWAPLNNEHPTPQRSVTYKGHQLPSGG